MLKKVIINMRESKCKLSGHMVTKNTWVREHVNFVAILSRNISPTYHQTTFISWLSTYGLLAINDINSDKTFLIRSSPLP